MGDNAGRGRGNYRGPRGTWKIIAIPIIAMKIKNKDLDAARANVIQIIVEGGGMIIHTEDEEGQWDGNDSNNRDRDNRD